MKIGFIRYHGQDGATVFLGDAVEAIKRDLSDDSINAERVAELHLDGFLTVVEHDVDLAKLSAFQFDVGYLI